MKDIVKQSGNFIFDFIIYNILGILMTIISFGLLFIPYYVIISFSLYIIHFRNDPRSVWRITLDLLKTKWLALFCNMVVILLLFGIIISISLSLNISGYILIVLFSFFVAFITSYIYILLCYELPTLKIYQIAFYSGLRYILLGLLFVMLTLGIFYLLLDANIAVIFFCPMIYTIFEVGFITNGINKFMVRYRFV